MKKTLLPAGADLLFACTAPQKNPVKDTVPADSASAAQETAVEQ